MVRIQGQYTLEDYEKALQLHGGYRGLKRLALVAAVYVLFAVIFTMINVLSAGVWNWTSVALPLVVLAALVGYQLILQPKQVRSTFRQRKDLTAPFEMTLSEDGVHVESEYGNSRLPWDLFVRYTMNPSMILLYQEQNLFRMIPMRLLGEGDKEYVRNLLKQNNVNSSMRNKGLSGHRWIVYAAIMALSFVVFWFVFGQR